MTERTLNRMELIVGTIIAIIMAAAFTIAGGLPLVITFVPGVALSWLVFLRMYINKTEFPEGEVFLPFFFATLAWQFLHFNEEFRTGFYQLFPQLYGAAPYTVETFVGINMVSYFVFSIAAILTFTKHLKFLVIPALFFIMYGAIGNAIAHTWWVIWQKAYFPGFYTGLAYWVIGPLVLAKLIGSKRDALIAMAIFAAILIPLLTIFMQTK
jgi:hypothetical protein